MAAYCRKDDDTDDNLEQNEFILFQCKSCNAVLADSTDSEGANSDLGVIVLRDVPDTLIQTDWESEDEDSDEDDGCDFSILSCAGCNSAVGKYYTETSEELVVFQNRATLKVYRLKFYTLDSSKFAQPHPSRSPSEVPSSGQSDRGVVDALAKLGNEVKKVQFMMCNFDQRIRRIEKLLKLPEIEPDRQDASADASVRSGSVTLNSTSSVPQGRADISGRNASSLNGHLDMSGKSDTFLVSPSRSQSKHRRPDLGRTWSSEGGSAPSGRHSDGADHNGSLNQRTFSKKSSGSSKRHERDCNGTSSSAHTKKHKKRKNIDHINSDTAGKKRRNLD